MSFIMNFLYSKLKMIGYIYGALFIYNNLMGLYPRVAMYHIRGSLEWISNYIPINTFFTIFLIILGVFIIDKLRKF